MKTTKINQKKFNAVKYMRKMRDNISREIADLSKEEIVEYFKKRQPKERILPEK